MYVAVNSRILSKSEWVNVKPNSDYYNINIVDNPYTNILVK